jgi:hypothetical protein
MRDRLPRDRVIAVLKHHGVDISEKTENGRTSHTCSKGDVVEVHFLPDDVPRHLLGRFAVKFGFAMGEFWDDDLLTSLDQPQPRVQ